MPLSVIGEQILIGMILGTQYALISVGLALLYGALRVTNVAHGDLVTLGGYIALSFTTLLIPSPLLAIPVAMAAVFIVGVLLDRLLLRTLRRQERMVNESVIVLTLGLSILLSNAILALYGPDYTRPEGLLSGSSQVFGLRVGNQRLLTSAIAVFLLIALFIFLKRSKLGLAIRAISQDPMTTRALGINANRIYMLTFGIAGALAGAAGTLIAPVYWLFPSMGFNYTVKGIVIIIMGGMGNMLGALLGSLLLGVTEALAILFLPSQFKDAIGLLIMVSVLLIRPQGLLGQKEK